MDDFRSRLKIITKPLHDEIEKNRFSALLEPETANMELYFEFLQKLLGFIEPIEQNIFNNKEWLDSGIANICNQKSENIKFDLNILGIKPVNNCTALPKMSNFYRLLGVWYVLEGSMIGASFQAPQIEKNLGLTIDSGLRYMYGYGDGRFDVWNRFVEKLNSLAKDNQAQKEIIMGAVETFLCMNNWLEEVNG